MQQIVRRGSQLAELLEPELRVLLFVFGGLEEDRRDLLIAFLFGGGGEIGVFVSRLGFAREGLSKILFGLGAGIFVGHKMFLLRLFLQLYYTRNRIG